ncbi:MAG: ATP-binding protein [Eubacteriales bacterium]
MRKLLSKILNLNFYLAIFTIGEVIAAVGIARLLSWALDVDLNNSPFAFFTICSVCIAVGLAVLINSFFLKPIATLSESMKKVSGGDFSIRLDKNSKIREIREMNSSFNSMTEDLGSTEMLQSDFVSNVSHEIKTPLSAIEGYATLLQNPESTDEERERYTEKILFNTRRLSELVGNVLIISKLESGTVELNEDTFRLDEQIRSSIMLLESKWTQKEIEFDIELDEITYTGDRAMLLHVWNNLIGNAVKFSPQGELVVLRLTEKAGEVIFTVEDRGPGISDAAQKHIFEKFYQEDTSHKQEGNGLGLSLVKRIVDMSGGTVKAENLPGGGCKFTVFLKNAKNFEKIS